MTLLMFLASFAYFSLLSAKEWTWVFVSGDSGDWLAASTAWFVPQPMGSPLFVLLGHFLNLFPGSLVIKETILLSCLPSAVTVSLVYLVTLRLTGRRLYALSASTVLLGAALFLTQSTILEQYAMAVMFVVLALYCYLSGHRKLAVIALGLGTATHIMVLPIAAIWLLVERSYWRTWIRYLPLFLLFGIVPYSMILVLMAMHSPPFIAGYFNQESITGYFFNTAGAIVGTLSVFDLPHRIYTTLGMLAMSIGLALVPAVRSLFRGLDRTTWIILGTVMFSVWYHLTCIDAITWTFLTFALPFIAILAGIGLKNTRHLSYAVMACAVLLLSANAFTLGADALTDRDPQAREVHSAYLDMPQDSVVVVSAGSYALALFYTIETDRPDLAPVVYWTTKTGRVKWYDDYAEYLSRVYNLSGETPRALISDALSQHRTVYIADDLDKLDGDWGLDEWKDFVAQLELCGDGRVRQIAAVDWNYCAACNLGG